MNLEKGARWSDLFDQRTPFPLRGSEIYLFYLVDLLYILNLISDREAAGINGLLKKRGVIHEQKRGEIP